MREKETFCKMWLLMSVLHTKITSCIFASRRYRSENYCDASS
jgi:hypothetical protein